jgi:hypothetical protein
MGWVVKPTPRTLYPRERHGNHCIGGWVGPRAGLDGDEKSRPPTGIRSPDRLARSESLYRLSSPGPCTVWVTTKNYSYKFLCHLPVNPVVNIHTNCCYSVPESVYVCLWLGLSPNNHYHVGLYSKDGLWSPVGRKLIFIRATCLT